MLGGGVDPVGYRTTCTYYCTFTSIRSPSQGQGSGPWLWHCKLYDPLCMFTFLELLISFLNHPFAQ